MNTFIKRLLFVLFIVLGGTSSSAQLNWTVRNPWPTDAEIKQIAFGDGKFVGVGTAGAVIISTDGVNWSEQPRFAGRPALSKVTYAGGQFVVLDSDGVSYTSPNAATWTKHTSAGGVGDLAYGKGIYLTLSSGNLFASSPDAINWTQRTSGTTLTGTSVDFGNNTFAAATGTRVYLTTPDALTWTARSFPTGQNVMRIVFGNDHFVAHLGDGTTAQSTDAVTWTMPATAVAVADLGYANGRFFATRSSNGQIASSTDGLAWTNTASHFTQAGVPSTITYGNGTYVSAARDYAYLPFYSYSSRPYTKLYSSPDAESWTLRSRFFSPPASVAYGLGMFVAGDHVSSDGISWSPGGFGPTLPTNPTYYYGDRSYRYEFAGDRFFAFQQSYPYRVYTSMDGVSSNLVHSLNSTPTAISYGAGRYVLIGGYGQILTSTDAVTWTAQNSTADSFTDIAFATAQFVVTTATSVVLTSPDGLTWTRQNLPVIGGWSPARIAYGDSKFVIMRENGELFTSSDGITWTAQPTLSFGPTSLAYANGSFVAGAPNSMIHTSMDGITWTARESGSSGAITDLAYGNGQWVGVARTTGTLVHSNTTSGAAVAPAIVMHPGSVTIVGDGVTTARLLVTVTGTGPFAYQWYQDGGLMPEATGQSLSLTLPATSFSISHQYRVAVTGPGGTVSSTSALVTNIPPQPPVIVTQPGDARVDLHGSVVFSVAASGTGPFSYQWYKDGQPLTASAHHVYLQTKNSFLTLFNVSPFDEGLYEVVVTGRAGSVTSRAAQLTLNHSRLINLSARANVGTGEDALFAGFVLANDNSAATAANWTVLARAAGPALKTLGVNRTLGNPSIDLYQLINGQQVLQANNDNWGSYTEPVKSLYAELTASVGAFDFTTDSLDAGLLRQGYQLNYNTAPQIYSAVVRGAPGETGIALVEFYDASSVHARLMNLSARARVGTGEDVLIAGFVITGSQPLKLLLRGVGPSLAGKGVQAFLANPSLTLFNRQGAAIQNNDTWELNTNLQDIVAATTAVGAFTLNSGSKDAAMLVTLEPGLYSIQVSSVDGASGVALAEIYEVP